ncbi:MAG TPA: NAD(P)-dependent oxidoreductase, partial [bacterium]|nr:NAD(P)-dependent oxidoreductase [bacterium]
IMGSGIARNLLKAGLPVTVWNRGPERLSAFGGKAELATSPAAAAAAADIVITMVADDQASQEVWEAEGSGIFAGVRSGALLLECSTVSPGRIAALAARAVECGCSFMDAPVAGSKAQLEQRQVVFLVGGSAENLARARPALEPSARAILHLGPVGAGAKAKLVNNMMMGAQVALLAEGLALATKMGLDVQALVPLLTEGAAASPAVKSALPRILEGDFEPRFPLYLQHKDLGYAVAESWHLGLQLPVAEAALSTYSRALEAGRGELDFSSVGQGVLG